MENYNITRTKLSILCLEDSKIDADLIYERLIGEGYAMQFDIVSTELEFISKLRETNYDLILSDYNMPGFNGLAALKHASFVCPEVPFICISGTIGDDTAVELLKQGASDYVLKDRLARLPFAIQRALKDVHEKEAFTKNEQKFKNLVENSLNGIFTTNIEGELLFANPALCEMMEYGSFEEFKQFGVNRSYKNTEDRVNFIERLRIEKRVSNHELILITKNGNEIDIIISAYLEEDRITGTLINVTEYKLAENELRKLSQAVEQSPVCVLITDLEGKIVYGNPKVCELSGYSSEELLGQNPRIFQSGQTPEKTYEILWDTIIAGKTWQGEFLNKKKNGELFWEFASISPIIDTNGLITNFLAVKEDITERKKMIDRLEEAKTKAEAGDRLKTAFIHNISHEMRTPLNGILGFSGLITQPDLSAEEKARYSDVINVSSARLLNTVTNYMDISMIESRNMEFHLKLFDFLPELHTMLERFQPLCAVKSLIIQLQIPPETGNTRIISDAELFRKILGHLLDNAIKFSHRGMIVFGFTKKRDAFEFFVKDDGTGISKEAQSRIFENFVQEEVLSTRGYEGSGLGLSIAQGMVQLLGGKIRVESEKGQGSVFFFTLPYDLASISTTIPEETVNRVVHAENLSILIADDDESNLLYLETILKGGNLTLFLARDGKEAVEQCYAHPEISLVLMDLKMPLMDGLEATGEIKLIRENLPVIAITAYAMATDEKKAREAGCDDYIAKPFQRDVLLRKLRKFGIDFVKYP